MAGIEQIVVHSKSYIVRWIQVPEHHSISWSVQPQKKSINFGIFKHPGTKNGLTPNLSTQETLEPSSTPAAPGTPSLDGAAPATTTTKRGSISRHDSVAVIEKLNGIGMKSVAWTGNCEADKPTMGRYDVAEGQGGMYGLVFDNTFSKTTGKTVTFVVITHPTNSPPKSGHHLHFSQALNANGESAAKKSTANSKAESTESLPLDSTNRAVVEDPRPVSKGHGVESKGAEGSSFYTGVLNKKRRKKGQGYAKRFFSLDTTSATLSYYQNRHSSALRGAIPLSLAVIGANEKTREFSIDSGAELWLLRASNKEDFQGWRNVLESSSSSAEPDFGTDAQTSTSAGITKKPPPNPAEDQEWYRIEQLVSKVAGTRDAVRGLTRDIEPDQASASNTSGSTLVPPGAESTAQATSPTGDANSYFPDAESLDKRPFWKRKPSAEKRKTLTRKPSLSSRVSSSVPISPAASSQQIPRQVHSLSQQLNASDNVHHRCMALLQDLDNVVASFSALIAESKARRKPALLTSASRVSFESVSSGEFFDAEEAESSSHLLNIRRSSDHDYQDRLPDVQESDGFSDAGSDDSSDSDEANGQYATTPKERRSMIFPSIPKSLPPLPLPATKRRTTVAAPKLAPPSIIGFLRKNAGKDLSTVTMPVTANEPTSLLQRLAEGLEYTHLLDSAASATSPTDRLVYIAAFAVSGFAYNRVKERALRKPFNPMLGETYELVREDLGYRFLAEKVSHHPVRAACQADSLNNGGWSFAQSPQPVQKFWGKSVELNSEGRARVVLHALDSGKGELYSWAQATCFLRNVIAGEKYVEPVQTMTILQESTGARAVATFKTGGMFSGRNEEVNISFFDSTSGDRPLPMSLAGKWTESLKRTDTGATIWKAGALVSDASKVYGFTTFAANLNEVTSNEEGFLPPTDSRLRPDQRALEGGDIDKAEALKARLEERQRSRRKVLEGHGQKWQPQYFEKISGEQEEDEVWRLKEQNGYWDRRGKQDWSGTIEVFET